MKFRCRALARRDKGLIRRYLMKMTGKSESQGTRLIRQHWETGCIRDRRGRPAHAFHRRYTKADIGLLAEVDAALGQMCGHSTRAVMRRMYEEYGDQRFKRLAAISNGQFYNLRNGATYRRRRTTLRKTRATAVKIGERRKPQLRGRPGFLRVDMVHQGDRDGEKGVYHINLVDDMLQWEHVATVRAISKRCLVPVPEELIGGCPFKVLGFHADNGSEYINHRVAEMLSRLHVPEFTKSRARHSNDNALVESKNGNVIRRQFGYRHIPKLFTSEVNAFARDVLSPYLNFHRPCLFPTEIVDAKGRARKRYLYQECDDPVREAQVLAGRGAAPQARRHHLRSRRGGQSQQRPRRRSKSQPGACQTLRTHRPGGRSQTPRKRLKPRIPMTHTNNNRRLRGRNTTPKAPARYSRARYRRRQPVQNRLPLQKLPRNRSGSTLSTCSLHAHFSIG